MRMPKLYRIDMLPETAHNKPRHAKQNVSSLNQPNGKWLIGLLMLAASASSLAGQEPPQTGTMTPSSGQGSSGNFAFTASSSSGYQNIDQVNAIFNWTNDG